MQVFPAGLPISPTSDSFASMEMRFSQPPETRNGPPTTLIDFFKEYKGTFLRTTS